MSLSWAARSDAGRRRSSNEDSYIARPDLGLFVVADGMGGHAAGEVASRLAVEAIAAEVSRPAPGGPADRPAGRRLSAGFEEANRRIAERATTADDLQGMATTAVALLVEDAAAVLAHVGDSRAYLFRGGQLTRLTEDHSWVEEQVRAGVLTERAAREHPWRNVVTRAIAGTPALAADLTDVPVEPGDRLLLCSDGLMVVSDDRIARLLAGSEDLAAVCHDLVDAANAAGGPDNVTVLVIEIDGR